MNNRNSTEKEKMLQGLLYRASDTELTAERIRVKELLYRLNIAEYDPAKGEGYKNIIRDLLPDCAPDVFIEPPFYCDYGYNIECGREVYMNHNVVILDGTRVKIGDRVLVGPDVHIYTATHPLDSRQRQQGLEYAAPVIIGEDTWIGGGAMILPGVRVGRRCVIGAGSVVTRDIPDDSIATGNPAKYRPVQLKKTSS